MISLMSFGREEQTLAISKQYLELWTIGICNVEMLFSNF